MTRRSASSLAINALVLLALRPIASGAAEPPPRARAQLTYTRHEGTDACGSKLQLHDAIAERLGYDPFESGASAAIVVAIRQADGELQLNVDYADATGLHRGSRRLASSDPTCGELLQAAALSIAMLLDPYRALTPDGPASAEKSEPVAEPPPAPLTDRAQPREEPADQGAPQRSVWLRAGGGALGSIGVEPAPTLGLTGFVGARGRVWELDLGARADWPASATNNGRTVRASLLTGSIVPCFRSTAFGLCALGLIGVLQGRAGDGVVGPSAKTTFYAAAGGRVFWERAWSRRLAGRLFADVTAPLTPTTLAVDGADVWTTPTLGAALGLELIVDFP
jgi:hypothetical protein